MQYNIAGMTAAPSYIQMSIGASASTSTDFFRAPRSGDMPSAENPGQVLFNSGNQICNVIDTASRNGFCDASEMPLDFIGRGDPLRSQQRSLEILGKILQGNQPDLEALRAKLRDPNQRDEAISRLATLLLADSATCRLSTRDYMARQLWDRQLLFWRSILPRLNAAQRTQLNSIISRTFNARGEPTAAAMDYVKESFFTEGIESVLETDRTSVSRPREQVVGIPNEGVLGIWYGFRMNVDPPNFLANTTADGSGMRNDYLVIRGCQTPTNTRVIEKYFTDPYCPISESPIPPQFLETARALARELSVNNLDPQNALVSILSPACALTARSRRLENYPCTSVDNRSEQRTREARATTVAEICARRAVGISVCSNFMNQDTPTYSNFCSGQTAFHAMTIIGARANGTSQQYLVQNSWGKSCKFANGTATKPAYAGLVQCEVGTDGMLTGRFWIDENLLFNNATGISTLRFSGGN